VLPAALADQIAAGEVVERPASVVKELVENALDAGARQVAVEVEGAGSARIRVADDGAGMERADAALAVLRHATSKIASAEDLAAISTLGFRGEALPSIAAVSRLTLSTSPRGAAAAAAGEGTRVQVDGGGPALVGPAAAAPGTSVEVRDLFYNTPARRKFLRGELAERRAILDVVTRVALCRPEVGFVLRFDGRAVLEAPAVAAGPAGAAERLHQLLGADEGRALYPFAAAQGALRVEGFLGRPDRARARGDHLYLFVNGRAVRDRALQQAVAVGYQRVLERGRWPAGVVHVGLPPDEVDVNVHPQKHEVRFRDARAVFDLVRRAVERTVAQAPWAAATSRAGVGGEAGWGAAIAGASGAGSGAGGPVAGRASWTGWGAPRPWGPAPPVESPGVGTGPGDVLLPPAPYRPQAELPLGAHEAAPAYAHALGEGARAPESSDAAGAVTEGPSCERALRPDDDADAPPDGFYAALRVVGQVRRTYLVCEGGGGLYLVDQHAAHERILFETLRAARARAQVATQPLLLPVTLELSPALAHVAEPAAPILAAAGIEIEPFGGGTFLVKAVPAALVRASPATLAREALEELAEDWKGPEALGDRLDAALARMACHAAARAGDVLGGAEAAALLRDLDQVPHRGHCPHGRPVFVEVTWTELERRLHRA
jgi:DNA mismatch repair protein MutL